MSVDISTVQHVLVSLQMTRPVSGAPPAGTVLEMGQGCRVLAARAPPVGRMRRNIRLVRLWNVQRVLKAG